jgi:hypothetical protein
VLFCLSEAFELHVYPASFGLLEILPPRISHSNILVSQEKVSKVETDANSIYSESMFEYSVNQKSQTMQYERIAQFEVVLKLRDRRRQEMLRMLVVTLALLAVVATTAWFSST